MVASINYYISYNFNDISFKIWGNCPWVFYFLKNFSKSSVIKFAINSEPSLVVCA